MPADDYLIVPNVDTFSVVFTLGDLGRRAFDVHTEEDAREAVLLLSLALSDLPTRVAHAQMAALGQPDLVELDYSTDFYDWSKLSGTFTPVDLSVPVKDFLTTGRDLAENEKDSDGFWYSMVRLRERLADRPDCLAQSVISEVIVRLKPFDGVPVLMAAWDRKDGAGFTVLSATAGMNVAVDPQQPEGLLEAMLEHGADLSPIERSWELGELGCVVHTGSFIAWHHAFAPSL